MARRVWGFALLAAVAPACTVYACMTQGSCWARIEQAATAKVHRVSWDIGPGDGPGVMGQGRLREQIGVYPVALDPKEVLEAPALAVDGGAFSDPGSSPLFVIPARALRRLCIAGGPGRTIGFALMWNMGDAPQEVDVRFAAGGSGGCAVRDEKVAAIPAATPDHVTLAPGIPTIVDLPESRFGAGVPEPPAFALDIANHGAEPLNLALVRDRSALGLTLAATGSSALALPVLAGSIHNGEATSATVIALADALRALGEHELALGVLRRFTAAGMAIAKDGYGMGLSAELAARVGQCESAWNELLHSTRSGAERARRRWRSAHLETARCLHGAGQAEEALLFLTRWSPLNSVEKSLGAPDAAALCLKAELLEEAREIAGANRAYARCLRAIPGLQRAAEGRERTRAAGKRGGAGAPQPGQNAHRTSAAEPLATFGTALELRALTTARPDGRCRVVTATWTNRAAIPFELLVELRNRERRRLLVTPVGKPYLTPSWRRDEIIAQPIRYACDGDWSVGDPAFVSVLHPAAAGRSAVGQAQDRAALLELLKWNVLALAPPPIRVVAAGQAALQDTASRPAAGADADANPLEPHVVTAVRSQGFAAARDPAFWAGLAALQDESGIVDASSTRLKIQDNMVVLGTPAAP